MKNLQPRIIHKRITMSSRLFKLSLLIALLAASIETVAEEVIIFYRPGFPDTMAPAQIFERAFNAHLVSCLDTTAIEKLQNEGGYTQLIAFDTFIESAKIKTLREKLLELDPSTKLIVYIKTGDKAYDNLECHEKNLVDFKSGSYLLPVMKKAQMTISEGAKLLDNGLSHCASKDGKALREYYATYESSANALFEIVEADAEQLKKLLESGYHFVEKLLSQTKSLVTKAKYQTLENNIRVGFQIAAVGISTLGPAMIKEGNADIAILLTESDPFNGEQRYSIRTNEKLSAVKIYEFINNNISVIRGGGDDIGAGLTCKANPDEIIAVLKKVSIADILRQ
jgi:hypothetical protein